MIPVRHATITAIDFEGTGAVKGWPDEPWQIGLVSLHDGRIAPETAFESLLRVGERPFNRYAPGRHADCREAMKKAPMLPALWPSLAPRLEGVVLAAHNAATETRYLSNAFPLHLPTIALDTLKIARLVYPGLRDYSLEALLARLRLTECVRSLAPGREPHDALYDAIGSAALLEHVFTLPGWRDAPLETLVRAQKGRTSGEAARVNRAFQV
jgi:DNA polymerase III epsilon subunit-like protein